ncbi:MAG: AMP-binding protein, partial [Acidimicrobiaceae bacterium]|nr:AMP-binding protein [Acidimicrobiaceae bacterium]
LFTHYWNRPVETARAFEGGWYRTGDVGRLDEDGFVYITGRVRELIISGGENVYPAEVERVLGEHPAVAQAAVIGRPDQRWGEVPVAFIVPEAGAPPDAATLEQWCEQRLAAYKRPRAWILVRDLPRTSLGKVKKHELGL